MDGQEIETGKLPMTVASEVIKYFSIGLYQNFARAVKELVSNAYDAQATEVRIRLDLLSGRIIVRDNGKGMDLGDLKEKYLVVGGPTPLSEEIDELGRKRIGTFGIGSVAVFPYCEKVTIITKKRKSDKNIQLDIDSSRFFKGGTFQLGIGETAEFPYKITLSDLPHNQGETIIILEGIKKHILNELREPKKLRGSSLKEYSGYEKFKWTLSQYCPLLYPKEHQDLRDFFAYKGRKPLRVWLDGEELFRNVAENARILEKGEEKFGKIRVKYAIMCPFASVRPEEAKGFQIRLRDVGIGLPSDFEITKLTGKVPGKLNYLTGEIHVLEGLADSLMIDRDSFSFTKEVADLQAFFRKKLAEWNEKLEDKSREDKEIYEGLLFTQDSDRVLEELKKAEIIQFPKERLRISKDAISRSKRRRHESASPVSRMKEVLTKEKGIKVKAEQIEVDENKPPIEISHDKKSVIIYERHPAFTEKVNVLNRTFRVEYSNWNIDITPSICKLADNTVFFNLSHPLFNCGLSERVVKELSLGLYLILYEKDPKILTQIEKLLMKVFISGEDEKEGF
ncbi:MAG: ATP-binding protein [Candidatus Bathyarchaeota archaeon]|nr:ATP-binding protein [Candidatus Bathyarchaeota archaeon]